MAGAREAGPTKGKTLKRPWELAWLRPHLLCDLCKPPN